MAKSQTSSVNPHTDNTESIPQKVVLRAGDSARQYLQDIMLGTFKRHLEWKKLNEEQQQKIIDVVDEATKETVEKMAEHLATDGRKAIPVTIDSVQAKGSLKIAASAKQTADNANDLMAAQGGWGYFQTYDIKNNLDRKQARPDPDQPDLAAETSEGEGS